MIVEFDADLWIWDARKGESWTFVTLPVDASEEIRELTDGPRRGFGSVRVRAAIGGSTWTTSIFPDSGRNAYVLPVKRAIRKAESLDTGDTATVTVEILDKVYQTGRKYAEGFKEEMKIVFDDILPKWNYRAIPSRS